MTTPDELSDGLDEHLGDEPGDDEEVESIDADQANRYLRRLRRLEDNLAKIEAVTGAERERIKAWEDERSDIIHRQIMRLSTILDGWARANEALTKAVTVDLPNGVLELRKGQPSFVCSDAQALNEWCAHEDHNSDGVDRSGWVTSDVVYKPDAGTLRHLLKPGEALGPPDADGMVSYAAHDPETGELVPYVSLRLPERKTFKYTVRRP